MLLALGVFEQTALLGLLSHHISHSDGHEAILLVAEGDVAFGGVEIDVEDDELSGAEVDQMDGTLFFHHLGAGSGLPGVVGDDRSMPRFMNGVFDFGADLLAELLLSWVDCLGPEVGVDRLAARFLGVEHDNLMPHPAAPMMDMVLGFARHILHHRVRTGEGLPLRGIEGMEVRPRLARIKQIPPHRLVANLELDHVAELLDGTGGILSGDGGGEQQQDEEKTSQTTHHVISGRGRS